VWWDRLAGSSDRPPSTAPFDGCDMPTLAMVHIRALVCWPTPSDPNPPLDVFQSTSRWVTEAAWVGHDALRQLVCTTKAPALQRRWGVRAWWVLGSTPLGNLGGCTGVQWDVTVQPTNDWPAGDTIPVPAP
jgi:hypothetical protein